jgi:hypothetical protein
VAEPAADRRDVDKAKLAFGRPVITGGAAPRVFQFVEAPLNKVPQPIEFAVNCHAQLPGFSHRDSRHRIAFFHGFANVASIIAPAREKGAGLRQVAAHDQVEAQIIRCLPRRDVRPHGQTCAVDAEVDLGREATARAAKTLSWSPPFAPAA